MKKAGRARTEALPKNPKKPAARTRKPLPKNPKKGGNL